jgi:hypothetical protein
VPAQIVCETTLIFGSGVIVTLVIAEPEQPFASVAVTVKSPAKGIGAEEIPGLCRVEVKPAGPTQLQETPPLQLRAKLFPSQIGLLLFADRVSAGLTVTLVVAVATHEFASVPVSV